MKFHVRVEGNPNKVREDLKELHDSISKVIEQNFAQVAFMDDIDTRKGVYHIEIKKENNGLVVVRTNI